MKWSFKLGRMLGIDVYVHFTFLLLLGFVGIMHWLAERTIASTLLGVFFFICLFACVLLHEFGHALTARRYGIRTHDIMLLPIGGLARLERMPERPLHELWVALAGPAVNVVIAAGLFLGLVLRGWEPSFSVVTGSFVERLLAVNIFLVFFNLLPAFPMDGGRVLRALLAMKLSYPVATRIAASIGQGMAFLFAIVGLFVLQYPLLLLIALFVWIGASQEAAAVEMKFSMSNARVRDAMLTHFRTLTPGQTLADAARHLLAGSQQDFPVVDDGRLVGILFRSDLFKALQESGDTLPVAAVMNREFTSVNPSEMLDSALGAASSEKSSTMAVMDDGRLLGLLTAENVGEFFMIRAALDKNRNSRRTNSSVPPVIVAYPEPTRRAAG